MAFVMMIFVVAGSCHFSNHVYTDSVNQQNNDTMNSKGYLPPYVELHKQGVLKQRGEELTDVLPYLDSVVDIYLTDFKYGCNETATIYSPGASDYVEMTRAAHLMMQEQVGTAKADSLTGLMLRGLMIRHLVMPNDVTCTKNIMEWIAENLPKETYINIMSQYTPVFRANRYPEINRAITRQEYSDAIKDAEGAGLTNYRVQGR